MLKHSLITTQGEMNHMIGVVHGLKNIHKKCTLAPLALLFTVMLKLEAVFATSLSMITIKMLLW